MIQLILSAFCLLAICQNSIEAGLTENQAIIQAELLSLTNPTPSQAAVINDINSLTGKHLKQALDAISGEQYTSLVDAEQYADRRFNRRIYDAIRNLLPPSCDTDCCDLQVWMTAECGRSFLDGNGNAKGYKADNFDFSMGAHTYLCPSFLFGVGADYEEDDLHYNQGGHNKIYTGQGALYAAYSCSCGYAFSDLILGYSRSHIKRLIEFRTYKSTARSSPKGFHGKSYTEFGLNYTPYGVLVQPFAGVGFGFYRVEGYDEHQARIFNLDILHKHANPISTYLGLHLKDSFFDCFTGCLDVAWQHRFDDFHHTNTIHAKFRDFGNSFLIKGCHQGRDGIVGAINLSIEFADGFDFYSELSGELWDHWSTYGYNAGVTFWW